jgi:hypothetical protein
LAENPSFYFDFLNCVSAIDNGLDKGTISVLSAMEGLDTYLQPATARILAACSAIKASDPNYVNANLNDYNGCLVNARVLPYRLFKQSNMQLWQPFTNPFSVDSIPVNCNTTSLIQIEDADTFKITRGNSKNRYILNGDNKDVKSIKVLNIIGQQMNSSVTQSGEKYSIAIPENIQNGYYIISFQHNNRFYSKTIII